MPAGDPAGYLPTVRKSRALAKRAGGSAYVPRSKQKKRARVSRVVPNEGTSRKKGHVYKPRPSRTLLGPNSRMIA